MSEEMTRKEVIDWLYRLKSHVPTFMPKIWHEKFIKALQFAIASLETDEAYNLMYEQPEFCADALSCKELLKKWEETTPRGRTEFDQIIMTMPSVLPKAKWIPCSEKKPNKGGEYLLWGKIDESEEEDYCFIGDYHEFDEVFGTEISNYDPKTLGFIDTEIEEYYSVVAWMPLPKPYKPQKSEDNNK